MSGNNQRRRSNDHRSDRYHDHRNRRDRDSRDRDYYSDYYSSPKRVPGLVSDPDNQLSDVDRAVQRGQREAIARVHSDKYSPVKPGTTAKDSLNAATLTAGSNRSPILTVTKPYYRSTFANSFKKKKRRFYNPGFLAVLPGMAGVGLTIASVVLNIWQVYFTFVSGDARINYKGLFHVCSIAIQSGYSEVGCETAEQFAESGSELSNLQQATRGLIIISAVIGFASFIVAFIFGLNVCEKRIGALIAGALFAVAGACGVAAMGCYSALLVDAINSSIDGGNGLAEAGTSFYLAWAGTGSFVIASIQSFMAHCARRKE